MSSYSSYKEATMYSIFKVADKYVKKILGNDSSGHDISHCRRVQKNALLISEKYNCDRDLISLTALLHDIDDEKIFSCTGHSHLIEFCSYNNLPEDFLNKMIAIIDFLSLDKKDDNISIETKIVQDADNLDALGAIGIARMFAFCGANGVVIYNGTDRDSLSHYYQRLKKLPALMNTPYARAEAGRRLQYMNDFIEQLKKEI